MLGDDRAAMTSLHDLAGAPGLGDLLRRARTRGGDTGSGSDAYAMHIKGGEINEGNLRQAMGWALAGDHEHGGREPPGRCPCGVHLWDTRTSLGAIRRDWPGAPGRF